MKKNFVLINGTEIPEEEQTVYVRLVHDGQDIKIEMSVEGKKFSPIVGVREGKRGLSAVRWKGGDSFDLLCETDHDGRILDMFRSEP